MIPRRIFCVLSARSLPYARLCLSSLLRCSLESLDLTLITDSKQDRLLLQAAVDELDFSSRHRCSVSAGDELADAAATQFAAHPNLRALRHGHPCWLKITDPYLKAKDDEEFIILDPDLYFPGPFQFEPALDAGIRLMWQKPHCLLPTEVVRRALAARVPIAHHIDVGVAHVQKSIDLDWLEWLLGILGAPALPRVMHIEALIWSALAMRLSGGYLDPAVWRCWRRSQWKRVALKLGVSGRRLLDLEEMNSYKCFHAGGEAKYWLSQAYENVQPRVNSRLTRASAVIPFEELLPVEFERGAQFRSYLNSLGYHKVFRSSYQ
jgi:hypothetical protein